MDVSQLIIFLLSLITLASCWPASTNVVDLDYASYQGVYNETGNATYFLGICFAASPTGKLRFKAPAPPPKLSGVQQANSEPPQCYQGSSGTAVNQTFGVDVHKRDLPPIVNDTQSDDCLFLNIWTPGNFDPHASYPVIFWIHGGGYLRGTMATFNGFNILEHAQHEAVVVEIQYRLGVFGFLAGEEMKQKGVLNAGLHESSTPSPQLLQLNHVVVDQNYALQWNQKYIHLFGGDPDRVTIWGQSAGAGSVMQHIIAHGGKTEPPLFHAAMLSSSFLPFQYAYNDSVPEQIYSTVSDKANCSTASDKFECLQNVDASTLAAIGLNTSLSDFFGVFLFTPCVDGEFIVKRPTETFKKGNHNGKKLIAISNTFEGHAYVNTNTTGTLTTYVQNLLPRLSESQVEHVVAAYSNISTIPNTTYNQAIQIMGECIFICLTYFMLQAFQGIAYKGLFAVPPGFHAEDVPYYFDDDPGTVCNVTDPSFQASFAELYTSFAKFLSPNAHNDPLNILPYWDIYSVNNTEMLFNVTEAMEPDIRAITTDPLKLG